MRKYFFPLLLIATIAALSACTQDGFDCREASACAELRDKVDGFGYSLEDSVQATALYGNDTSQQVQNWSNEIELPTKKDVTGKAKSTWLAVREEVPAAKNELSAWRFDPAAVPRAWQNFRYFYLPQNLF
jgi:hypothetical protein